MRNPRVLTTIRGHARWGIKGYHQYDAEIDRAYHNARRDAIDSQVQYFKEVLSSSVATADEWDMFWRCIPADRQGEVLAYLGVETNAR